LALFLALSGADSAGFTILFPAALYSFERARTGQEEGRFASEPRGKSFVASFSKPIAAALRSAAERGFRIATKPSGKCFPDQDFSRYLSTLL
jgi:hypothetical protein